MAIELEKQSGVTIDGRLRLVRYLDGGCFGAVYRAEQLAYGVVLREVAVKVSRQPMSDVEARATFHDALIMSRVVDSVENAALRERFITVHDAGRCPEDGGPLAGHPYMVMELVPGRGMHHYLKYGPFPLKRALACFSQLLEAVTFMHCGVREEKDVRPVIHRDLKPANLLLIRAADGSDRLKITDFGLALSVDNLLGWTESGGTMAYLAPESFSHNICSPQSDVYALALIFYEMITGATPFAGIGHHLGSSNKPESGEVRRLHLRARQTESFALLDSQPELRQKPALVKVLRQALQADMASRPFRHAGDFQAAWSEALRDARPEADEMVWDLVARLLGQAEQCYAVGETAAGDEYLDQAEAINRDRGRMPDRYCSGRCYLFGVRRFLRRADQEAALQLATEGRQRRPCRSTLLALTEVYRQAGSPAAATLLRQSEECRDKE